MIFLLMLWTIDAAATAGFAQGLTGQIGGTVVDAQQSPIPGVTVTVRNVATQLTRDAITDDAGRFVIVNLVAGGYDVRVTITGFGPYEQKGVQVTATERVALPPITLQVGGVTEAVAVQATGMSI